MGLTQRVKQAALEVGLPQDQDLAKMRRSSYDKFGVSQRLGKTQNVTATSRTHMNSGNQGPDDMFESIYSSSKASADKRRSSLYMS